MTTVKRREFLKVLGATTATGAAIGCSSERVEKLIPYLVSPDETVPGVSTYYSTTCRECSSACGIIAETRDGRAIKLEGNPEHPVNRGALCARGQAALQGLYNPDRYRTPMIRQGGRLVATTWDNALKIFSQKLGEVRANAGNAVFINRHESGGFPAFLNGWLAGYGIPAALSIDPDLDYAASSAFKQSLGVAWPKLDFNAARLIISVGADFLDGWGASVPQQLDFADARAKLKDAPRFIYVGPRRSLTGLNADQWIDAKPGSETAIVQMLAGGVTPQAASQASGVDAAVLTALKAEFDAAKPAMVLAGGNMDRVVAAIALSGGTLSAAGAPAGFEGADSPSQLRVVAERMQAGQVPLLMTRNVNPAYAFPKTGGFAAALAKVPFKVSFSSIMDDTSEMSDLVLPDHHSLESWGDAQPVAGTLSLQQPVMDPVFDTRATADVLMALNGGDTASGAKDYRTLFISRFAGGAAALAKALPRGLAAGSVAQLTPRAVPAPVAPPQTTGDFLLMVYPSPVLGMGDGANKPWLQELPDPVNKIAWQTVAELNPATAKKLEVEDGDHVTIETANGKLSLPVYVYPGVHPDVVAVQAGRGHADSAGRYAKAGSNVIPLVSYGEDRSGAVLYSATRAKVTKDGDYSRLVTTEGSSRQHGRGIGQALLVTDLGRAKEARGAENAGEAQQEGTSTPAEHARALGEENAVETEMPGDASHEFLPGLRSPTAKDAQGELGGPPLKSKEKGMYDPKHWSGMANRRWAMTIDLARCTGCSACVTACYAENNIPTVGADWQAQKVMPDRKGFGANITRSREMAWIRLERYFEGGEDGSANFDTRFVPMLCQHCGNAPCEPVCPVFATYHAPDGLNIQVYNRCVGTRYCSNNCPYKVRYFNWFGYGEEHRPHYAFPEPLNWQLNPDVTVRGKGVMEKCTFCVQRIREAENRAALEHRGVQPDEFTTACAEACPSRAITFGDAADPNWTVTKKIEDERGYHVFEELNTYTAVVYLKKVNHPAGGVA